MLYMFQAVPPPIIRSSKTLYTASGTLSNLYCVHVLLYQIAVCVLYRFLLMFLYGYVYFACLPIINLTFMGPRIANVFLSRSLTKYPMLYIQFRAPDDGRRNRLKHVEHFKEINKLRNVASCSLNLEIYFPFTFHASLLTLSNITHEIFWHSTTVPRSVNITC